MCRSTKRLLFLNLVILNWATDSQVEITFHFDSAWVVNDNETYEITDGHCCNLSFVM